MNQIMPPKAEDLPRKLNQLKPYQAKTFLTKENNKKIRRSTIDQNIEIREEKKMPSAWFEHATFPLREGRSSQLELCWLLAD